MAALKGQGIPLPLSEVGFKEIGIQRKFRFDYYWPEFRLALEIEGGIFTRQAHGSIRGILRDKEKYSLAASAGVRVIAVPPNLMLKTQTFDMIKQAMRYRVVEGTNDANGETPVVEPRT